MAWRTVPASVAPALMLGWAATVTEPAAVAPSISATSMTVAEVRSLFRVDTAAERSTSG